MAVSIRLRSVMPRTSNSPRTMNSSGHSAVTTNLSPTPSSRRNSSTSTCRTVNISTGSAEEEKGHRHMLLELYEQRFGPNLPPIRREDVKGFLRRRPAWLTRNLPLDTIRKEAEIMELEAERFYAKAAEQAQDVGVRKLLGDLAEMEKGHESLAAKLTDTILSPDVRPAA